MAKEIRPLSLSEAREIYRRYFPADFGPDEIKPWRAIAARLQTGDYECLGLFEEGALAGYAFFASLPAEEGKRDYLLDYFAVLPALRGQGLGAYFLRNLKDRLPRAGTVIGEAENPAFASDDAERAVMERRMRFYLRNGVADTGVDAQIYGVEYRILLFFGSACDPDAVRARYAAFYHSFFPDPLYRQKVRIR